MKKLSKTELKKAISKMIRDTASGVIELAHENGCSIVAASDWNVITDRDLDTYPDGAASLEDCCFYDSSLDSLTDIAYDVDRNRVTLASDDEIAAYVKTFDEAKAARDKVRSNDNFAKIEKLKAKIEKKKAEIRKAENLIKALTA